MRVRKTFRYRVYPTPEQEARLLRWDGALRFLWNVAHEQRLLGLRHGTPRYYTAFDQMSELTALRAELPWLADVPRNVCAELLTRLDLAWQRCFKKLAREPRWKKKGRHAVALCEPHPKAWSIRGTHVRFPKLGVLRTVLHRPVEGTPKTCTLVRDVDAWFACISCELEMAECLPSTKPAVGIDRGVTHLLADSAGRLIPNPQHFERQAQRLARHQRRVSAKMKGSANRKKAALQLAKLHRHIRRQRDWFLHREANHYANNHGTVVVEKLAIVNMTASAKGTRAAPGRKVRQKAGLNRSILGSGWGRFVELLRYKLSVQGGRLVEVAPAYSSQTCAQCGHVEAASRQGEWFVCTACSHCAHADCNAARVLLRRGTHGAAACGGFGEVSRPVKQELRVARRGTRHNVVAPSKAPACAPG